ncbi:MULTISPECIES: restriction endonuclease subunit S [Staphylococcus]|uniref:restriction endonuclease subunit S n=1 Tax=Staphylococcus TaxID=1279 RepID=UPI00069FFC59|nr:MULTISPECIES: restriction endonuclease subunit S [Staphylococcus]
MEFKEMYLIDCVNDIIDYRGKTPKKLKDNWSEDGDYRAISAKNIKNMNLVNQNSMNKAKASLYKKWMKKEIDKGDILLTSEAPLGETLYWDFEEKIILSQRVFGLKVNNEIVNSKYLFAYMQTPFFKHELFSRESGTTVTGIRRKELEKIVIKVPSMYIQNYIGQIIYNINYKINNNNKIIANLEELSQTLFKSWFVDFEFPDENGNPYKSSGGEMIDSELGEIPKGWKVSKFNDYIENIIAGDWGKQNEEGNYTCPTRIIRGADLDSFSKGNKGKAPIRYILEKNYKKKKLIAGDIIIEISGGSPTQSTGRTLLIDNNIITYNDKLVSTNFCKVIRPSVNYYSDWINEYLKYLYDRNVFFNYENGTTGIKNLDYKSVLNTMKIISPEIYLIKKFHYQTHKYYNYIQTLGYENKKLQDLRDTLLPKLMSGEIEIPDDIEVNNDELSI